MVLVEGDVVYYDAGFTLPKKDEKQDNNHACENDSFIVFPAFVSNPQSNYPRCCLDAAHVHTCPGSIESAHSIRAVTVLQGCRNGGGLFVSGSDEHLKVLI